MKRAWPALGGHLMDERGGELLQRREGIGARLALAALADEVVDGQD